MCPSSRTTQWAGYGATGDRGPHCDKGAPPQMGQRRAACSRGGESDRPRSRPAARPWTHTLRRPLLTKTGCALTFLPSWPVRRPQGGEVHLGQVGAAGEGSSGPQVRWGEQGRCDSQVAPGHHSVPRSHAFVLGDRVRLTDVGLQCGHFGSPS